MDNFYTKGELLQVHTKNCDVFEGRFYGMAKDKTKISLYDVKEIPHGDSNDGVLHYYDSEIREVVKLQESVQRKILKISQEKYEEIVKVSKKYIFINQVDRNFHEALKDLNQHEFIAVGSDGATMGRKCKMPFLVLSTPDQIYIFDIQVMQYHAFDSGLKSLLESDSIKKIAHDCRKLSDCLYHKHNVKLKSVFDTQVGDIIITKNKTVSVPNKVKSLAECLNTYLGLQLNTIDEKLDIVQSTERPLATKIKDSLAKNIAFLHHLSEVINEEMQLPFYRGVECYIESIRSSDDFKAWELCGKLDQVPKDFKTSIEY